MVVIIIPDTPRQAQTQQIQTNENTPQQSAARIRWWQRLVPSYILAFLIVSVFTCVTLLGEKFVNVSYFPNSATLLLGILFIALLWGSGPGIFATILSCAVLFYIDLFPNGDVLTGALDFNWKIFFPVGFFALSALIVVALIGQREAARRKALQAEETAETHASDLAQTNQALVQANQVKDLFVSITSHELKTPITTIRGQAQLALRRLKKHAAESPELDGLREAFVKVDEQTNRLTNLLNELLDLTSLRSGKQVLSKKPCDLSEICRRVVEEQQMLSERSVQLEMPAGPVMLYGDAGRLGQVVTNLVNNALKYSPPESPVRVVVTCQVQQVRIAVQDAGQGIAPEQQENIFQPFYRTSDARASSISGTGLGLAICKDIVEQHQGHIWYTSIPGEGSTFYVDLPLKPLEAAAE